MMISIILILVSAGSGALYYFYRKSREQIKQLRKERDFALAYHAQKIADAQQKKQQYEKLLADIRSLSYQKNELASELTSYYCDERKKIESQLEVSKNYCLNELKSFQVEQEVKKTAAAAHTEEVLKELSEKIETAEARLKKIQELRHAAIQATLREEQIKANKDNYRLLPKEKDLSDIKILERVSRELNSPRILYMLIWSTYWQPLAKKQFPLILHDKTKVGIYKITNLKNNMCYIGQSKNIYQRWCTHCKCGLGIDTPPGNKLYKAMREEGLENFTFELLTECSEAELDEKERYFIGIYEADTFGYNGNKGNK